MNEQFENPFEQIKSSLLNYPARTSALVYECPNCSHTFENAHAGGCRRCGSPLIQAKYIWKILNAI